MAEHTITLSESTYRDLLEELQTKGVTVDSWISSKLSSQQDITTQPSSDFSSDLVTSFGSASSAGGEANANSDTLPEQAVVKSQSQPLSEIIAEILESVDQETDATAHHSSQRLQKAIDEDDYFGEALIADMKRQGLHFP